MLSEINVKMASSTSEDDVLEEGLNGADVTAKLDFSPYYSFLSSPEPSSLEEKLRAFVTEGFLISENGVYGITTMGALLFAKSLALFPSLSSKGIRLLRYATPSRFSTMGKLDFNSGYMLGYESAVKQILTLIAMPDKFENGVRVDRYLLPEIAIREALANAMIHQDIREGYGPLIELFPDRIEFSNSGSLLVPKDRLIDTVPVARNRKLADFLRRVNIGDSSGSGFDKMAYAMELTHLPSPQVNETSGGTRVVLSFRKTFADMDASDRKRSAYDHACLRYLEGQPLTNASLRERFGLGEESKFQISRLLRSLAEEGVLKEVEGNNKNQTTYLPYWA